MSNPDLETDRQLCVYVDLVIVNMKSPDSKEISELKKLVQAQSNCSIDVYIVFGK